MKIMQLIGTKNCKVFVNHVELIASSGKSANTHKLTGTGTGRKSTYSEQISERNRKPRQVHENPTTTNKFNQNACKKKTNGEDR